MLTVPALASALACVIAVHDCAGATRAGSTALRVARCAGHRHDQYQQRAAQSHHGSVR
jgi:hypothetical protein